MADNRKSDFDPSLWWQGLVVNSRNYNHFGNQDTFLAKIISDVVDDGNNLFFYIRIEDEDMPHKMYLEDPCSLSETINNPNYAAYLTYGVHSQIVIRKDRVTKSLGKDDVILIRCLRGQNGDLFSLQNVEFVELVSKTTTPPPTNSPCISLTALNFNNGSGFNNYYPIINAGKPEIHNINNFTFESIPVPSAVTRALRYHRLIGLQDIYGSGPPGSPGRDYIVDTIHIPTYKAYDRDGNSMPQKWIDRYKNRAELQAWSSNFLMACYRDKGVHFPQYQKNALGFEVRGCCYPNAMAARNRNDLLSSQNPERYKDQILLMVFSNLEIAARPNQLGLVPGDASVVGQDFPFKPWEEIRTEFKNVTRRTHMNIYVGPENANPEPGIRYGAEFIGGNLGNTTGYKDDHNKFGFCKLVKITGFNPNPTPTTPTT